MARREDAVRNPTQDARLTNRRAAHSAARRFDLHVHSTVSDGLYAPREVVRLAAVAGLGTIALTDHDAVEGIDEALAAGDRYGVRVIPGVEISTYAGEVELHVLGYLVRHTDPILRATLTRYREARLERARAMLARLEALGLPLSWERVRELAGPGSIGRPHIARALLEEGHVHSVAEAFDRLLNPGKPAYVPREKATPGEAIRLIHGAGGLAALAHPWAVAGHVADLAREGLDGLEVYYSGYGPQVSHYLRALAREQGLICTGGSDFHGASREENRLGGVDIPQACLDGLYRRHRAGRRYDEDGASP